MRGQVWFVYRQTAPNDGKTKYSLMSTASKAHQGRHSNNSQVQYLVSGPQHGPG